MTDERHVLVIFPHPDDETFWYLQAFSKLYPKRHTCNVSMLTLRTNGQKDI